MRIVSLDSIKGNELLAKDVYSGNDALLMPAGAIVKKEYVRRLRDLSVEYLYIEDEIAQGINLDHDLEFQIQEQCQEAVRNIMQKYSYQNNNELEQIRSVADEIIRNIMEDPGVIFNLSAIRVKSSSTYSHSLNVCALAVLLSIKLKLPKGKIRDIAIGCLLHDIGITYIKSELLDAALEDNTENVLKELKKHIIYGYSAVEKMEWLSATSKDIIISHHERLDGSGYPFHVKEGRIKIGSRIAAVCDEFDSRVYGNFMKKMKVHDAIDYIVSQAGVQFDLRVVKAFVDSVAAYPTGSLVRTNEGETAIVLRQNAQCPTRPVIRIVEDSNGNKPDQWIERDLVKELTLFITDTI